MTKCQKLNSYWSFLVKCISTSSRLCAISNSGIFTAGPYSAPQIITYLCCVCFCLHSTPPLQSVVSLCLVCQGHVDERSQYKMRCSHIIHTQVRSEIPFLLCLYRRLYVCIHTQPYSSVYDMLMCFSSLLVCSCLAPVRYEKGMSHLSRLKGSASHTHRNIYTFSPF